MSAIATKTSMEVHSGRLQGLDSLRGVAVVLMITDHVIKARGLTGLNWVSITAARAAMPLFMIIAGYLWEMRGVPSWRRYWELAAASMAATVFSILAGIQTPDILSLYLFAVAISPVIVQWPFITATIGVVQSYAWKLPYTGYPVGNIVTMCALGVLLRRSAWKPQWKSDTLTEIGQRPLAWYLGHLAALALWRQW